MNLIVPILLSIAGLALVLFCAEQLVKGVAGFASGLGASAFLISVVFLGFDPENLAVGAVGSLQGASGVALGTIVGSAMVAIALAFGITALVVPMRFERVPRRILAVSVLAVLLMGALAIDGRLSRFDGLVLLVGYAAAIVYLLWLGRRGVDIEAKGEVAKELEEASSLGTGKALGVLLLSSVGIVLGSELLVEGARDLIAYFGFSETVVGMTILALAISIEEVARELPAAMKGHPEISYGNVVGSILAFFLFNAGVIALISPIEVDRPTLLFYLPLAAFTVAILSLFLLGGRMGRLSGAVLVTLYVVFAVGGYLLFGGSTTPLGTLPALVTL